MQRLQRSPCIIISGALRTTTKSALEIILGLFPLDLFWLLECGMNRILATQMTWRILELSGTVTTRHRSIPENEVWKNGVTHLLKNSIQIYTNGSKLNGVVGSEIFSESVGIAQSIRLPDHCSVFQAEVVPIQDAARIIGDGRICKRNVTILSDSQTAIKALNSNVTNSKTVHGRRRYFNEIAERYDIHIVWVPRGTVVFRATTGLMNLLGGARSLNSPINARIWSSLCGHISL